MTEILIVNNLGDQRQRYRFVYEPLFELQKTLNSDIDIKVFTQQAGVKGVFQTIIEMIHNISRRRVVIYCGVGVNGLIWVLASRITRNRIIVRLGGEPSENFLRLGLDHWSSRRYKTALIFFLSYIASKIAMRFVHGVIVVNEMLGRKLRENREIQPDCPVFIIPQPILSEDAVRFEEKPISDRSEKIQILTVTNFLFEDKLEPVKTLIDSFLHEKWRTTACDLPNVVFNIIGGGQKLKALREYVTAQKNMLKKSGVDVHIIGRVQNPDSWYNTADIFVYGSKLDGIPNVLLEAQFYGLPIVVNDLEEFRNMLKDGRNACFYETGNDVSAATVIGELLKSPEKMKKMGQANWEEVRVNHGVSAIAEKMKDFVLYCQTRRG